jgi:tagatose-6-phosphate ketose/aldose isomerase
LAIANADRFRNSVRGIENLILTGSGSSEYVGDCVRLALQKELGVAVTVVGGGTIVTQGLQAIPPTRPALLVSLARSGDSPESFAALSLLLGAAPDVRHLVITCNENGRLASGASDSPQVCVFALDDATNDRSLVMTSSFTNLALAVRILGYLYRLEEYRNLCRRLSVIAEQLLLQDLGTVAQVAALPFRRAVFLGSGSRFGSTRETALKMLEMTSGRVASLSETFLGFRHGPMSFADKNTLIVCFLSSDSTRRAFELDLILEMNQKGLGISKLVVGEDVPPDVLRTNDVAINCAGLAEVGDDNAPVIDVLAGQLLAFFKCLNEGLRPDAPSDGIINRVVQSFTVHLPNKRD